MTCGQREVLRACGRSFEVENLSRMRASKTNLKSLSEEDDEDTLKIAFGLVANVFPMLFMLTLTGVVLSCRAETTLLETNDLIEPVSIRALTVILSPISFCKITFAVDNKMDLSENA